MYLQYFGLTETPFSITPDPAFVYLSARHRDALAHLLYGVGKGGAGGFVQLTGEVGTGKTTICRCLLEQVPENTRLALILNPMLTPRELLASICEELGVDVSAAGDSSKALVDALNAYLLQQHAMGKRVVVVIDEAQNLSPEALEQVRLLTNLETAKDKLLQMVLLGQPELRQLLQRQNLRQLAQRITARYHLEPLNETETHAYVRHRMQVAGAQHNPFRKSALHALYQRSGGVPRLINIIADRALAAAYASEATAINARMVHAAANEVQPSEVRVRSHYWPWAFAALGLSGAALIAVTLFGVSWPAFDQPITGSQSAGRPEQAGSVVTPQQAVAEPPPEPAVAAADPLGSPSVEQAATPQSAASIQAASPQNAELNQAAAAVVADRPDTDWLSRQNAQVWHGMATLWRDQANAVAMQAACDGQLGTGYACLRDYGSWSRVRQLGLPVILVLQDDDRYHVILRGVSDDGLLLGAGSEPEYFERKAIEPLWLGEFLVSWPQAPDWPLQIRRGESGVAVNIVMQMAALADVPWNGGGIFDADFENWLRGFQQRNGLTSDGIVGPKTLLYLMAPTIDQPRLLAATDERF